MIDPPTPHYLDALRHAHTSVLRVNLYDDGVLVGPLPVVACTLTLDGRSNVWRNVSLSLGVDLWNTDTREYLERVSVQQGEVTIEHGIAGLDVDTAFVQLARLKIDQLDTTLTSATRAITAYDRALFTQEHLLETGRPLDQPYATLITTMLQETLPGEPLNIEPGINLTLAPSPGKVLSEGSGRLSQMQGFAEALDAWIFNEPDGSFTLAPYTPPLLLPVWSVDAGAGGVLIDSTEAFSRREQYNAIGITFTPVDGNDWRAFLFHWDEDPNSPTFYDGPFGKRPKFFNEEYDHLPSADEALIVADRKLDEFSGATRSLTLDAVYNPLLVPGDMIEVVFPDGETENHITDTITLELGPTSRMLIETRLVRENVKRATRVTGSTSGTQPYHPKEEQ